MVYSWKVLLLVIVVVAIISNQTIHVNAQTLLSPLKQLESGISVQDIKCKEGFVLVIKKSNDQPSCVRPTSEQRLLSHGWVTLDKIQPIQINDNKTLTHQNTTSSSNGTNATSSIQFPFGISTPTISSTKSGIKIISIEMSPDPLKVGDKPQFKITYQNISDKPIYHSIGCTASSLGATILPSDSVVTAFPSQYPLCPNSNPPIYPKEITTNEAYLFTQDPNNLNKVPSIFRGYYQIMKAGTLHVNLSLYLWNEKGGIDTTETIQFNVNATQ